MSDDSFTDYPKTRRWVHCAPLFGALPTSMKGLGLGSAADAPSTTTVPPTDVTPANATTPPEPMDELAVAAGTAILSGATVGGIAAGTWRGAGIGAGVNVGVWAGLTAASNWSTSSRTVRTTLVVPGVVGILGAAALVMTRDSA
jgi:hypothetical protein